MLIERVETTLVEVPLNDGQGLVNSWLDTDTDPNFYPRP